MLTSKPRLPIRSILFPGLLPSPIKKLVYRMRGYRIGRGVSLGLGCVIDGDDVTIGEGASVGFLTIVRGKSVRIGPHVQIGSMSMLDTPIMDLGEGTKINEQVFIGGMQFPDSRLTVGRNCQIMQMSFINPTRSITIGDDTGIGGDCLVFGHTSWLSSFEGYPVEYDSIEIGRSVSVAWRVFILPGARIGDGAVIGANSLVRGTIPGRCLAVGFPARVVSKAPEFPREVPAEEKVQMLHRILEEMTGYLRGFGLTCAGAGPVTTVSRRRRRFGFSHTESWTLLVEDGVQPVPSTPADVLLSLVRLTAERRRALERDGAAWIDLEAKERSDDQSPFAEEVIQFLRRHGVRLLRDRAGS